MSLFLLPVLKKEQTEPTVQQIAVRPGCMNFTLQSMDGKVKLSDYKGKKVYLKF